MFSETGGIFASATVTLSIINKELATDLWGKDENGVTWECIYFVNNIKKTYITYKELNPILGYKDAYVIQGFNVLSYNLSAKVFDSFDLFDDVEGLSLSTKCIIDGKQFTWKAIIKSARISIKNSGIEITGAKVYQYLRGELTGIDENEKRFYGKFTDLVVDDFSILYHDYKEESKKSIVNH